MDSWRESFGSNFPARFTTAQDKLGDEVLATLAIGGNRIYLRGATAGAARQEYVWCIGE